MSCSNAHRQMRFAALVFILAPILAAGGARGGTLTVAGGAAFAGTYGLQATVGTCASMDVDTVSGPTLTGPATYEACDSLATSGTVNVSSGLITFRAGRTVALGNGFSVSPGATFRAEIAPGIYRPAFVQDDSPTAEKVYRAVFHARFDGLTVAGGESFDHFDAYDANGNAQLRVRFKRNGALMENRLVVDARLDDGTYATNEGVSEVVVAADWRKVEVVWKAATAAGADNGSVELLLDDVSHLVLTGLDNDQGAVESVRWGAVAAIQPSVTGSMDLDEFSSSRAP